MRLQGGLLAAIVRDPAIAIVSRSGPSAKVWRRRSTRTSLRRISFVEGKSDQVAGPESPMRTIIEPFKIKVNDRRVNATA